MKKILRIRNALISVFDKKNIFELSNFLFKKNINLMSTGGTFSYLKKKGLKVKEISKYIEFPEILNGKVKTLHPKIHAGILCRKGYDDHIIKKYSIIPIDMVIVNLYPFSQISKIKTSTLENIINNIDIGGVSLIRAAAKNYEHVLVVTNCNDYDKIMLEIDSNNFIKQDVCFEFAKKAFQCTANYDYNISNYLYSINNSKKFPQDFSLNFSKKQDLRYGENPHQKAALYIEKNYILPSIVTAKKVQGQKLSYNNISDVNVALECVKEFLEPTCVIVKHMNPCGVSTRKTILESYKNAYLADPVSAFGGVIAFNRELDKETAQCILKQQFVEVIIAPSLTKEAKQIIEIKNNIRLLVYGFWTDNNIAEAFDYKKVNGGILIQDIDNKKINFNDINIVTKKKPSDYEIENAFFSWKIVKFVKSNAIVCAKNLQTIGIGIGQTSRVFSIKIANLKAIDAGFNFDKSIMASDAFFPFRDSIDLAASFGITCIIQPGGSIRDNEIINAANEHNISMIFTHIRHFKH
ncbi:bifunctional phosphoribosylaminoimidazolecarboxamide formyltransferase/IMP cyclohydrolase [Candidatus Tachikawaea gelatinosa]|uniref:Bifunctional purine biosynthesis protein PurH n=1 Tax=Candidatus Tachikawaea gelatinosa TaxID=1410383 RepID=A0A090ARY7_9ENTR|nr:bifunctional phosphoribosylaminoimidazolecarboxamide formyltransferase/IMP cyclohydrolase [Candidatus Tachikawaea gelatinosa]BAP58600.1 bifunctional phosphoribosylaminoimidazolecarboxamide formyltransferase/IMP cyclohydrolase [Candidatus Tachikawaea gelatinosa]